MGFARLLKLPKNPEAYTVLIHTDRLETLTENTYDNTLKGENNFIADQDNILHIDASHNQ